MSFGKKIMEGLSSGFLSGLGGIIAKVKADPTKVVELEADLEKLKINLEIEEKKLDVAFEEEITKRMESENKAITDRWAADMNSDSWLSKNARPVTMLSLLIFLYIIIIFDSIGTIKFEVKESYIDLMQGLLMTSITAYFGIRGVEKIQKIISLRKNKSQKEIKNPN